MTGDPAASCTVDRIADLWGDRDPAPERNGTVWPARADMHLDAGIDGADVDRWVHSACVLCSNGCGLDIAIRGDRMVGVRGRVSDVVNHGRLGPKGLYGSTPSASSPQRLTRPLIRRDGQLVETDWGTAMGLVVVRSKELLDSKGPLSHGFYTSGQLFLEEYYTLAVIGKAGLGTPHMDGNTRLCTATAAASLKESFGADGQPGSYTDIEHCDAIFLFGHNMAETQTVLWARILDRTRSQDPPTIVCVDPRHTPVAAATLFALATTATPPGPNSAASAPSHSRRWNSVRCGRSTAYRRAAPRPPVPLQRTTVADQTPENVLFHHGPLRRHCSSRPRVSWILILR